MGTELQINNIVGEILVSRAVRECSNNVIMNKVPYWTISVL